jgi:hypothetical protein
MMDGGSSCQVSVAVDSMSFMAISCRCTSVMRNANLHPVGERLLLLTYVCECGRQGSTALLF